MHVKSRAESHLIKTFLETSGNKKFRSSILNTSLYKQKVLGEDGKKATPGPYYTKDFFKQISSLRDNSGVEDITTLSLKQIYLLRLNENVLNDCYNIKISLPVEISNIWVDWGQIWTRVRTKGIDGLHASVLFLFIHNWLPSNERILLCRNDRDPDKLRCRNCGARVESAMHVVTECANKNAALKLQSWIRLLNPEATIFDIFHLNVKFKNKIDESACSILTANAIYHLWEGRNKGISPELLTAYTAVLIRTLSQTKFVSQARVIERIAT